MENDAIPATGALAACPRCRIRFEVMPEQPGNSGTRWKAILAIAVLVLCAGIFIVIGYDGKLDKNYFLQPGTWQGEMTYLGKQYPFEMVIEKAQDGYLAGYMDWVGHSPRYRLAIRGTYVGNHLVFEDYSFLERQGTTGLNDKKDVYIIGNEMSGTDKNGNATFHALKRESAPF